MLEHVIYKFEDLTAEYTSFENNMISAKKLNDRLAEFNHFVYALGTEDGSPLEFRIHFDTAEIQLPCCDTLVLKNDTTEMLLYLIDTVCYSEKEDGTPCYGFIQDSNLGHLPAPFDFAELRCYKKS